MEPPEPAPELDPNRLNEFKIEQTVIEILSNADLETATEHSVRTTAAERLSIDLSDLQSKLLVRRTLESFLLSSTNLLDLEKVHEQTKEVVAQEQQQQRHNDLPNAEPRPASDGNGKLICMLSEKKRVTVQEFGGRSLVSIRDYYQKNGKLLPSRSGISLTANQWSTFRSSFPDIEAAMVKMTSRISTEGTEKQTATYNPTAVTALASQRKIPFERAETEAHEKQTETNNPTSVIVLASQRQISVERARTEAEGKQTETDNPTSVTALASQRQIPAEGAQTEADASNSAMPFSPQALVPISPTRLNGKNYHCWMHQMEFFLKQLKIAYVLTDPCPRTSISPEASFEETVQAKLKAQKWIDDDYICCHNILNSLSDHLFDKYSSKTFTAKGLWEELKSAYDEDFQTKRSQVNKYIQFQMVDGVSVLEQVQELHKIADSIVASGIWFDENFHVSTIISKLPPSWKQCRVKLMQEDVLPLNKLMYLLRDEEEFRNHRRKEERFKSTRVVNPSHDDKLGPRKREMKIVCYNCGKEGHKSMNCPRRSDSRERGNGKENDNIPVSSEVNMVEKAVE